jgi:hypothetical protein
MERGWGGRVWGATWRWLGLPLATARAVLGACACRRHSRPAPLLSTHRHTSTCTPHPCFAGVILYMLLAGTPPFHDKSEPRLLRSIMAGKYSLRDPVWQKVGGCWARAGAWHCSPVSNAAYIVPGARCRAAVDWHLRLRPPGQRRGQGPDEEAAGGGPRQAADLRAGAGPPVDEAAGGGGGGGAPQRDGGAHPGHHLAAVGGQGGPAGGSHQLLGSLSCFRSSLAWEGCSPCSTPPNQALMP